MAESIVIGVIAFTLVSGVGLHILAALERGKRKPPVITEYKGPVWNSRGRRIG